MIVEGNHSSRNLTAAFFTDYLYKWRGLFEAAVYRVGLPAWNFPQFYDIVTMNNE